MNVKTLTILSFIIFTIVFFSCNEKNEKQENKINDLQKQLSDKDSIINVLSEKKEIIYINPDTTEILNSKKEINEASDNIFMKDSVIIINTKNFMTKTFKELHLEKLNIMTSFYNTAMFYKRNEYMTSRAHDDLFDVHSILNLIWNQIDRDSESVNSIITENKKRLIYSLFRNNTLYEDSGVASIVKALLTSYIEIQNNDIIQFELNSLTQNLYTQERYGDLYWETNDMINDFASKEVKEILSDENFSSKRKNSYNKIENRIFYVYTFWIRRIKEGNQIIVYELLKELHQNVSKEMPHN